MTHTITVEKPKGRFRVTVTMPSGKKEVLWRNSLNAVTEICNEYAVPSDQIKWTQMK